MPDHIKSIWNMIEGDARFMRHVNGGLTIFWIVMIPVSYAMHWLESVTFVSALSLWAIVSGHWAAWQAARVEDAQQKEERKDTDGRLVKRLIRESNLKKSQKGRTQPGKAHTHKRKSRRS
jgi:hypothetical protein